MMNHHSIWEYIVAIGGGTIYAAFLLVWLYVALFRALPDFFREWWDGRRS